MRRIVLSRVGLIGENSVGYVSKLIDIWNNGDCAVLLDWRIPLFTLTEMMLEANVSKCFVESKLLDKYREKNAKDITDNIELIAYDKENNSATLLPQYVYDKFNENYSKNEAIVIYSSGTTGKSKGIILSHFAINTNADSIIDYMQLSKDDCVYMVKTISHASSMVGELLVSLKTNTQLLIAPIIVPPRIVFNNISKYKVTILCINPTLLQMYMAEYESNEMKYGLSSLRDIYVHGAKANYRICDNASKIFNWCSIYYEYGLTEAGPRVTTQKISFNAIDSVGKAIKNVQVKVVDLEGHQTAKYEKGVIYVRTPSRFLGYISGNSKFKSQYEGWVNTGDIGYFDDYNELHIVDRLDDVINLDSHKIYPNDIEKQILKVTDIKECIVVRVDKADSQYLGCLCVGKYDETILRRKLRAVLLPFEVPKVFVFAESLPRNANGKIDINKVRMCFYKQ